MRNSSRSTPKTVCPSLRSSPPVSAGPAAGIEDAGLARGHRIDEAGLSPDVVARGGAFAPHLRVVGRMLGIGPAYLVPPVIETHSSHPRRCTSGAVRGRRRAGS